MSKIYEQLQPVVSALDDRISEVEERAVTVDSELSTTSTNPVQNKVVTGAVENKVNLPLLNGAVDYGTAGQVLKTKGDGTTEWGEGGSGGGGTDEVFTPTTNGLVPAPTVEKATKEFVLTGNGTFEKMPFDSVACQNLITILQSCVYEKDVSINISNLAESLGVNSGGDGDDMTFQFGQHIPKGKTARTLTGLEGFSMTEIRLVVALDSDFQQGAFCMVAPGVSGSPYIGVDSNGDFYYSNQASYPGNFSATPSNLTDFIGSEPKEVTIKWLNPSGYDSRKYMKQLKFFFNGYNPSCGFTLFRISGYDGSTKLFNVESTGTNGELHDTMTGNKYTFNNTSGMSIVEVN